MSEAPEHAQVAIRYERGPYTWLLLAQIFFIGVTPLVGDTGAGWAFLLSGIFAILLAGIVAARQRRRTLILSLIFFLPAVFAWAGPDMLSTTQDDALRFFSAAICFLYTSWVILRGISRHKEVTRETILGGINVYLLLTFAFMMLHAANMTMWPDSYLLAGSSLKQQFVEDQDSRGFATLLYFSFTTMTTLGYGDITPAHAGARMLASVQAVTGQLYVAIFIARLVSLEVSQRAERARR